MGKRRYQIDPSRKWTDPQKNGVLDRSGSVIVSAAAGTGKTSVLTERCLSLVAGPEEMNIDELLVVTFTEAAAMEMRERIRARLVSLYEEKRWARLLRQLALLDAASISTLHAFCLQVVRENFARAGIEPDAGILDEDEAQLLKDEVLGGLFDALYNSPGQRGKQFVEMVAHYGQGRDETIRGHVKHLHEYLRSLPPAARDEWKERAVGAYALDEGGGLTAEQFGRLQRAMIDEIDILLEMGGICLEAFEREVGPHKGLDSGRGVQEFVLQLRAEMEKVTTSTGLKAWVEAAGNPPWAKVGRWGDVPEHCRGWAKWLHDHWKGKFIPLWLASVEAWSHGLRIAGGYAELLIWLVNQFEERYSQEKRRIGQIDYSDMEEYALRLLTAADGGPSDIARAYQQRYQVVMVDEFQDINPIQASILRMVSRESSEEAQPNLFAVGDVKQSIYGFRMTDPGEFLKRQAAIAGGAIAGAAICLQENFRSRPEVLDAVNRIFRRLMRADESTVQYDESAELRPGRAEYPPGNGPAFELHILEGGRANATDDEAPEQDSQQAADDADAIEEFEKEAYLVSQRIRELVGTDYHDGQNVRKLQYRDMVVLLRSTQSTAEVYANVLRRCGIPVYAELRSGYFASQEIKNMLAVLAVLENMQQDIPLAAVLRSPLLGEALSDADLADIRAARQDLEFHQAVRWYARSGPEEPLRRRVAGRVDMLERWRRDARLKPLAEVIATVYEQTGALEYVTLLNDGLQCRANLVSLLQRARQFGQFSRQGLRRFVTFVQEMIRSGKEATSPTAVGEGQDVVRVMSIHAAKGLEFPVVFLADLARRFNDMDFNGSVVLDREGTLGIEARDPQRMLRSDTLVKLLAARKVRQQSRAEELRVLYVAMTRAKDKLVLVGTTRKEPAAWLEEQRQLWHGRSGPLSRYMVRYAELPVGLGRAGAGRRQKAGYRRQETGDRRQKTGGRRRQSLPDRSTRC